MVGTIRPARWRIFLPVALACGSPQYTALLAPRTQVFLDARPRAAVLPEGYARLEPGKGTGGERVLGDPNLRPAPGTHEAVPKGHSKLHVSVQVCRSGDGVPTEISVLEPVATPDFNEHYRDEIAKWRYTPYLIDGQAVPTCSTETFDHDLSVPSLERFLEGRRIAGDVMIRLGPSTLHWMKANRVRELEVKTKLCLNEAGVPTSVTVLFPKGVSDAVRNEYRERMMAWRYLPYRVDEKPVSVCTTVLYHYTVR